MKTFVTGAAGFIGSSFVDRLLADGHHVVGYDNFSTGQERFLTDAMRSDSFRLVRGDTLDLPLLSEAMSGCDVVFHFAANADVRFGLEYPKKNVEQNTVATFTLLEAMRATGVKRIVFSSTGSIYGEPDVIPTPEDVAFPMQTSVYGASKLACEGLIQAYCEGLHFEAYIFRFVSILGARYSHGHVFDFYRRLREDPSHLHVLGDGCQRKSYLYVEDCIDGVLLAMNHPSKRAQVYNLGTDEYCNVNQSIGWITAHLGISPQLSYAGGTRGWVGDSPFILLDCTKIRRLGWSPSVSIRDGILRTLEYLQANPWVYEVRQ